MESILKERALRLMVSLDKEDTTPYKLARQLDIPSKACYDMLEKFDEAGLVEWTRGTRKGGAKVAITPAGKAVVPRLIELARLLGYDYNRCCTPQGPRP